MTFKPCHAAVTAADNPAAPEPTTNTSQSISGSSADIKQRSSDELFLEFDSRK
jgi:hypothetical protein